MRIFLIRPRLYERSVRWMETSVSNTKSSWPWVERLKAYVMFMSTIILLILYFTILVNIKSPDMYVLYLHVFESTLSTSITTTVLNTGAISVKAACVR